MLATGVALMYVELPGFRPPPGCAFGEWNKCHSEPLCKAARPVCFSQAQPPKLLPGCSFPGDGNETPPGETSITSAWRYALNCGRAGFWAGCEPDLAATGLHGPALRHFHIPAVSLIGGYCDYERCTSLWPTRFPILRCRSNPHMPCLPLHQVLAELVVGVLGREALNIQSQGSSGAGGGSEGEAGVASGIDSGSDGAEIAPSEVATSLERFACDEPAAALGIFAASSATNLSTAGVDATFPAANRGAGWRYGEDVRDRPGWIYEEASLSAAERKATALNELGRHRFGHHHLRDLRLAATVRRDSHGFISLNYLRSYEGLGNATVRPSHSAQPSAPS